MHTYMYRLNALFTVASTALAVICAAAALTDWTFTSTPSVSLKVKSYDGLQVWLILLVLLHPPSRHHIHATEMTRSLQTEAFLQRLQREAGEHRAWMTLQLNADLQSVFHWNTKQVQHEVLCSTMHATPAIARSWIKLDGVQSMRAGVCRPSCTSQQSLKLRKTR